MRTKNKKIGEILIENGFITKEILDKALSYQKIYGGGITQYLISCGYISEENLAKCLSSQFAFPYLPLRVYNIPENIIQLVDLHIAERYWLIPVDKMENILTVVMSDPLDEEAVRAVEKSSGCKVQPFVGILSDIIAAIERYYKVVIRDRKLKKDTHAPLFIDTGLYKGFERRRSVRLQAKIDVHFPVQELYKKSKTKDVSHHGFLFESENILPVGSYVTLEIKLPEEAYPYPIACVIKVMRVMPLKNKKFDIGAMIIKIPKDDLDVLMKYSCLKNI